MKRTDWDRYYSSPMPTAFFSRAVVRSHLLRMIRLTGLKHNPSIAELGGGGSCFSEAIRENFRWKDYTIYDSCPAGISLFLRKNPTCQAVQTDLLQWNGKEKYDLVFSVGLIEHFSPEQTELLIRKHFQMTKKGGYVILFSPTPTILYRLTRGFAELLGIWQFPDERPIYPQEIRKTADSCGNFITGHTIYTNILTQYAVLYRK